MSRRVSTIPLGSWPRRMPADLAAGYVGETNVGDFLKRVGKDYPMPRVAEGRRRQQRILSATRKRHAHRLANEMATSVQNEQLKSVQNEDAKKAV
jgi:hypothetical protein